MFDLIVYLRGRKEYLQAQTRLWESGSTKERTAQARLSEICTLLSIVESLDWEYGKDGY